MTKEAKRQTRRNRQFVSRNPDKYELDTEPNEAGIRGIKEKRPSVDTPEQETQDVQTPSAPQQNTATLADRSAQEKSDMVEQEKQLREDGIRNRAEMNTAKLVNETDEDVARSQQILDDIQAEEEKRNLEDVVTPKVSADDSVDVKPDYPSWQDRMLGDAVKQQQEDIRSQEEALRQAEENAKLEEKRAATQAHIAAIGDAFTTMANLYGTTKGAVSQKQSYISPVISDNIDRARTEYTNRIKQINANIEAAKDRLTRLNTSAQNSDLAREKLEFQKEKQKQDHDRRLLEIGLKTDNLELRKAIEAARNNQFEFKSELDLKKFEELVRSNKAKEAIQMITQTNVANKNATYAEQVAKQGSKAGTGESFSDWRDRIAKEQFGVSGWENVPKPSMLDPNYQLWSSVNDAITSKTKQDALMSAYPGASKSSGSETQKRANPMGSSGKRKNPMD